MTVEKFEGGYGKFIEKVFAATYLVRFGGGLDEFILQKEEVQQLKFIFSDKLFADVKSHPEKYSPHPESYWKLLCESIKKKNMPL